MNEDKSEFKVFQVGELREKYYGTDEHPPAIQLNTLNVPELLRHLIPIAEKWGISDDMLRMDAVRNAESAELASLKRIVRDNDDLLDDWLAGPEAQLRIPSKEYLAFSNMRMAADGC